MFKKMIRKWLELEELDAKVSRIDNSVDGLDKQMYNHAKYVASKMAELQEYTRVDADVGMRGNNTIVLTGVFKKKAFIQFYDLPDGEFEYMVKHMMEMRKHALIRTIDKPPHIRGCFDVF